MNITIAGVKISQNKNGLYSLNDLYKASGSNPNQSPSDFLKIDRVKRLVNELIQSGNFSQPVISTIEDKLITYGVKHVLISYANFLSLEIGIDVLNVFMDDNVKGKCILPSDFQLLVNTLVNATGGDHKLASVLALFAIRDKCPTADKIITLGELEEEL